MKTRGWNPPSLGSGATRMEDGRAGSPSTSAARQSAAEARWRLLAANMEGHAFVQRRRARSDAPYRHGCLVSLFLFLTLVLTASAQTYSIDWYKVAGGGGTSTGGVYAVSGTIGQHDAGGPMTGGNYSLTGGFWALISVVQTTGRQPCSSAMPATR